MKHRNTVMAVILKLNPGVVRGKTVLPEREKLIKNRARRNHEFRKELRDLITSQLGLIPSDKTMAEDKRTAEEVKQDHEIASKLDEEDCGLHPMFRS